MSIMAVVCGVFIVILGLLGAGRNPTDAQSVIEITCIVGGLILCFMAVVLARLKALDRRLDTFEAAAPDPADPAEKPEAVAPPTGAAARPQVTTRASPRPATPPAAPADPEATPAAPALAAGLSAADHPTAAPPVLTPTPTNRPMPVVPLAMPPPTAMPRPPTPTGPAAPAATTPDKA